MLVMQLSDFHLRGDGKLSFRVADTLQCLQNLDKHLKNITWKPDAIVLTGDLADNGDARAYTLLRDTLQPYCDRIFAIPGNHDRRDLMRSTLGDWSQSDPGTGNCLCHVVEDLPVRLIMFDTMSPGSHSGHCTEETVKWLDRNLQARPDVPTIVFMHHPPFICGMGAMDEPFENVDLMRECLSRAPWARLACGHMHRPITTSWAGLVAMTSPAVAMQIDLDLSPEGGDTFRMETSGYMLHHWTGKELNSHVCQIPGNPTFSGPHPFVDSVNPTEE